FVYPSLLTPQISIPYNQIVPSRMKIGSYFLLSDSDIKDYKVSIVSKTLTPLKDRNLYLGAIDSYSHKWTKLWGWKKSENKLFWFSTWIDVEKKPLSVANTLRIPTSVLEKLNAADE